VPGTLIARSRLKPLRVLALALACLVTIFTVAGYREAVSDPTVRRLVVTIPWAPGPGRTRIVLFSDLHVHGPDMPPERVARLVQVINNLHPDVVIAAGDFLGNNWIGRSYAPQEAISPLKALRARLGTYAVLGNNDAILETSAISGALESAHVRVLKDEAVTVGPIALGGLMPRGADPRAILSSVESTASAMDRLPGLKILVAHEPDYFPLVPPRIVLLLAGHTHCGQIALPFIGPIATGSDYGRRYGCGLVRENGHALLVSGGLGTSHVPLRFFAPPDLWVLDLVPARK
jgi:predicted MPP superfamily phosphohydrolase